MLPAEENSLIIDNFQLQFRKYLIEKYVYAVFLEITGDGQVSIPTEVHEQWFELDVSPDDKAEIFVENERIFSSEQELALIHPGRRHWARLNVKGRFLGFSLFLHQDLIADSSRKGNYSFIKDPGQRIQKLFGLIQQYFTFKSAQPLDDFLLDITKLIISETRRRVLTKDLPANFLKLVKYMDSHFAENLSMNDLAKLSGISKFHLSRRFKTLFGQPPMQYITELRLKKAAEALKTNKDLNISDVAFSHGFGDLSSFNKRFKEKFSFSPREYRRLIDQNSN